MIYFLYDLSVHETPSGQADWLREGSGCSVIHQNWKTDNVTLYRFEGDSLPPEAADDPAFKGEMTKTEANDWLARNVATVPAVTNPTAFENFLRSNTNIDVDDHVTLEHEHGVTRDKNGNLKIAGGQRFRKEMENRGHSVPADIPGVSEDQAIRV